MQCICQTRFQFDGNIFFEGLPFITADLYLREMDRKKPI